MGNCCTRVKSEADKAPKQSLSENVEIQQQNIDYFEKLKETLNIEIESPTVKEEKSQRKHVRTQSYDVQSISKLSNQSFIRNYIVYLDQNTSNEQQFQQFQNRIYQDKLNEMESYMKMFANHQGEISIDYNSQIDNFKSSMEFLLNSSLFSSSQSSQKINILNQKYSQFLLQYYEFQEKIFRQSLKLSLKPLQNEIKIEQENQFQSASPKIESSIDLDTNKSLDLSMLNQSTEKKDNSNKKNSHQNSVRNFSNFIYDQQNNQPNTLNKMILLKQIENGKTLEQCKEFEKEIIQINAQKSFRIENLEEFDIIGFLCEGKRLQNNLNQELDEQQNDKAQIELLQEKKKIIQLLIDNVVEQVDSNQKTLAQEIRKDIFTNTELLEEQLFKNIYKKIVSENKVKKGSYQQKQLLNEQCAQYRHTTQNLLDDEFKSTQGNDEELILGVLDSPNKSNIDNIIKKLKTIELDKQRSNLS